MTKKILFFFAIFQLAACGELQQVVNQLPQSTQSIGTTDIASGLREALNIGIEKQVRLFNCILCKFGKNSREYH